MVLGNMPKFSQSERELLKEYREAQKFIKSTPITGVVETPEGDVIIPIKSVVFNSPSVSKDRFSPDADFGHPAASSNISVYFHHAKDKFMLAEELMTEYGYEKDAALDLASDLAIGKQYIGVGVRSKIDEEALFYNLILSRRSKYKNVIKKLAIEGHLDSSTGVKFRENDPDDAHLIKSWHLADLTLTPTPDDPNANVVKEEDMPKDKVNQEEKKADSDVENTEKKVVNPLMERLNAALAKQEEAGTEKSAEDTEEGTENDSQPTVGEVIIETLAKMQVQLDALTEKSAKIDAIQIGIDQVHEVMPHLIDKVAAGLVGAVVEEVEEKTRRSPLERDLEKAAKIQQSKSGGKKPDSKAAVKPGYGQFPANAPGGQ